MATSAAMHQPMDPLPSIFSLTDLEALGDDKWDMDATLFDGYCSPFASGEAADCLMPAADERGGAQPINRTPPGMTWLTRQSDIPYIPEISGHL